MSYFSHSFAPQTLNPNYSRKGAVAAVQEVVVFGVLPRQRQPLRALLREVGCNRILRLLLLRGALLVLRDDRDRWLRGHARRRRQRHRPRFVVEDGRRRHCDWCCRGAGGRWRSVGGRVLDLLGLLRLGLPAEQVVQRSRKTQEQEHHSAHNRRNNQPRVVVVGRDLRDSRRRCWRRHRSRRDAAAAAHAPVSGHNARRIPREACGALVARGCGVPLVAHAPARNAVPVSHAIGAALQSRALRGANVGGTGARRVVDVARRTQAAGVAPETGAAGAFAPLLWHAPEGLAVVLAQQLRAGLRVVADAGRVSVVPGGAPLAA
eukprot:Rhum_TRINITY_DN14221_c26_g1::Rhum_TRINITY_DN14221_c26_g1_i1::g.74989::m.74989